jgi:pimeloyl-ACP methyl ester carboxylesterase
MEARLCLVRSMLLVAALLFSVSPSLAQDSGLIHHFDYEQQAPLALKEIGVERRGNVGVHDIAFASPKGGMVPAYLVVPQGKGPFAAVIWGHWYWPNSPMRNRKEFLEEAVALAQVGVVSLLTDGPIARPGHVQNNDPLAAQNSADLLQQVVDMRRGLDLLLARKDVDPQRIAYVGHSYNAMVGAILSGVDRRFKAFVLMAGPLSREVDLRAPEYQRYREKVGPEKFDALMAKYSFLDAGQYVSHAAPAVIFMQFATQESFLTPARAREYETVVSSPKIFRLYEAPHALNAAATSDRIAFLTEQLKLKRLPAATVAGIPELYQPPQPN